MIGRALLNIATVYEIDSVHGVVDPLPHSS